MAKRTSRVQQEIKQTRPFRSLGQEAVISLLRTTDLLRRRFQVVTEAEGVTGQQYNVLRILRGAGAEGLPTLEIAERMIEQAPGITRLLDRIEARKWVRRERCPTDRRQVTCRITDAGLEVLDRLEDPVTEVDAELDRLVPAADLECLIRALDRLRAGLAAAE